MKWILRFVFWALLGMAIGFIWGEQNRGFLSPMVEMVLGTILGFFVALLHPLIFSHDQKALKKRVEFLEESLRRLHQRLNEGELVPQKSPESIKVQTQQVNTPQVVSQPMSVSPNPQIAPSVQKSKEDSPFYKLKMALKKFFTEGNVVAKVGMILLFIGVAFLLKLASDYGKFPIEARLISVAVGSMALLIFGFRLRQKRVAYSLILQGGGIGIFYMNAFIAYRLYDLLPAVMTFAILLLSILFMSFLAVQQKAKSLAVLATLGGYLAPILASTGSGNHVALFSYYAILNLGVFLLAWCQAWRLLNLIGFAFTFGVGAAWGVKYYKPEFFLTVEPFLILNFLYYFVISILYAVKKSGEQKRFLDGTLIFGTPLLFFSMQYPLVSDKEYGVFLSAFVLGALYLITTRLLWKKYAEQLRFFIQTFLGLGAIFTTLSAAFILKDPELCMLYAIEGAGLVAIGAKQQVRRSYYAGFLLLFLSLCYYTFLHEIYFFEVWDAKPLLSPLLFPQITLVLSFFFAAYCLCKKEKQWPLFDRVMTHFVLLFAGLFFAFSIVNECLYFFDGDNEVVAIYLCSTVVVFVLEVLRRYLNWYQLRYILNMNVILLGCYYFSSLVFEFLEVTDVRALVWLPLFASQLFYLKGVEKQKVTRYLKLNHFLSLWIFAFVAIAISNDFFKSILGWHGFWSDFSFYFWVITIPFLGITVCKNKWPIANHFQLYAKWVLASFVLMMWISVIVLQFTQTGAADPWPYYPFVNPFDFTILYFLLVAAFYFFELQKAREPIFSQKTISWLQRVYFFTIWLWLTYMIVRFAHNNLEVPFHTHTILDSLFIQSAISIFWSVFALVTMLFATRRQQRFIWTVGAFLLFMVVLKLFFVDFSRAGTVARIISFLGSGGVFVLIGYLSPMPPAKELQQKS